MQTLLKSIKRQVLITSLRCRVFFYRIFIPGTKIRIIIGAGNDHYPGWFATDMRELDITKASDWNRYFNLASVDNILAEHIIEHLSPNDAHLAFQNIYAYLRPGGVFRVAVPDGYHPSKYYIDMVRPGGSGAGSDDHKVLYTVDMMMDLAKVAGFMMHPIEYFDSSGVFHSNGLEFQNGYIERCSKNYAGPFMDSSQAMKELLDSMPVDARSQFIEKKISYTSLLVDFIKKPLQEAQDMP